MRPQLTHVSQLDSLLPKEWEKSLVPDILQQLIISDRTLVVLDDDPTGTQTVHDVTVVTNWSVDVLQHELQKREPAFFVLTNSRSLPLVEAQALNAEIGANLRQASKRSGRDIAVVSRSDSTLRGHYPGEVNALADALNQQFDATLIIPFFLEGGRYTIDDVHYVAEGDTLTPAAETPFARDSVFGYNASNLREWVEEKTCGTIKAGDVASISIDLIRIGGPEAVASALKDLVNGRVCVVNAASMRDMEVFVCGLLLAEASGKRFLYRTAASFVKVRAGVQPRPLLTSDELNFPDKGGALFVVGSHVPKTTAQVDTLLAKTDVVPYELNVSDLLTEDARHEAIQTAIATIDASLADNRDVALVTSRKLVTGRDETDNLQIGKRVSESLVAIVRGLTVRPRYLVAKGGITSSDIATDALEIKSRDGHWADSTWRTCLEGRRGQLASRSGLHCISRQRRQRGCTGRTRQYTG